MNSLVIRSCVPLSVMWRAEIELAERAISGMGLFELRWWVLSNRWVLGLKMWIGIVGMGCWWIRFRWTRFG